MTWPPHWEPVENSVVRAAIESELQKELKFGHPLYGVPVTAIRRRFDRDDYLFQVVDGSDRVAEVHLTFAGEREKPPCPWTVLHNNLSLWADAARAEDASGF